MRRTRLIAFTALLLAALWIAYEMADATGLSADARKRGEDPGDDIMIHGFGWLRGLHRLRRGHQCQDRGDLSRRAQCHADRDQALSAKAASASQATTATMRA